MQYGYVKMWDASKGFGFIVTEDEDELFVHANDLDITVKGKKLNYFIVHGAKDNAVPVEAAREAVQKLKELGIPHKYVEIKNAYHTGYNRWTEIFQWLRNIIDQYKRVIK